MNPTIGTVRPEEITSASVLLDRVMAEPDRSAGRGTLNNAAADAVAAALLHFTPRSEIGEIASDLAFKAAPDPDSLAAIDMLREEPLLLRRRVTCPPGRTENTVGVAIEGAVYTIIEAVITMALEEALPILIAREEVADRHEEVSDALTEHVKTTPSDALVQLALTVMTELDRLQSEEDGPIVGKVLQDVSREDIMRLVADHPELADRGINVMSSMTSAELMARAALAEVLTFVAQELS